MPIGSAQPIKRSRSLTNSVVDAVRLGVREGTFLPDHLYSVYQLAETLQVSRSPVREALLKLEEAGMVKFERNRGFRILLPQPRDIAEIFAVRLALEPPAARRVCDRASDEVIAGITGQLAILGRATSMDDEAEFWAGDQRLHELILLGAGNARAAAIVEGLREKTRLLGVSTTEGSRTLQQIETEHQPIVDAILARDGRAAERCMRTHLETTGRMLIAQVWEKATDAAEVIDLWEDVVDSHVDLGQ